MSKRNNFLYIIFLSALSGIFYVNEALSAEAITLVKIASTVDDSISQLATILLDVSLISGIGFIMASFFKFHQHKLNPNQVSMSQGVSLLLIGCGLTLIHVLIPTTSVAILGSTAKTAQVGGKEIKELIGGDKP